MLDKEYLFSNKTVKIYVMQFIVMCTILLVSTLLILSCSNAVMGLVFIVGVLILIILITILESIGFYISSLKKPIIKSLILLSCIMVLQSLCYVLFWYIINTVFGGITPVMVAIMLTAAYCVSSVNKSFKSVLDKRREL